jgi:energy-coupling factor transporter ATP-binding protein EcfA2
MAVKVNKIGLQGFRGATAPIEITLDTTKPVILIFGENGTGKSTIADAFDFVCNCGLGSLEDRSMAGQKKGYVAALGGSSNNPKVALSTSNGNFTASMARTGPTVSPEKGCPDARILRRSNILKLLNAQPKQRFDELKAFITVPGIEKSENSLRDAHRNIKADVDETVRAYTQAKTELDKFWVAEGKPGKDPLQWAQAEAKKNVAELESAIDLIDTITEHFRDTDTSMRSLELDEEALSNAQSAQESAQQEQQKVEAEQPKVDAPLLKLLQDAKSFISGKRPGQCPVCEQQVEPDELSTRLDERLSEMSGLSLVVRVVAQATHDVKGKEAVVAKTRKSFIEKSSALAKALKDSNLKEIDALKLEWSEFQNLLLSEEYSADHENEARDFLISVQSCRQSLEASKQASQKSINQHNAVKGHLETHTEKLQSAVELNQLSQKLEKALEIVSGQRKDYIEEILAAISGEVERLYTVLHPGEGIGRVRFHLKDKGIGSLEFFANFLDIPDVPPQAYYSESHLDTLGICVFIALSKYFITEDTIIILDDVLTSVDGPHLDRFMNLLHAEAGNFNQVVVTTHYRPWRDRYRWAKGPTANIQVIELGPWTLKNGLQLGYFLTALDELKTALVQPIWDRQVVASKAGIVLESLLDFLTLKYRCSVPRNARNEYSLGDLASGIDAKLAKTLCCRFPSGSNDEKVEFALKPLIDAATSAHWIRNCVGCHLHELGSEISDSDVRVFGQGVIALADGLICTSCGALPSRRPSGSHWQCTCGNLELHPLVKPGADPRTVADEF